MSDECTYSNIIRDLWKVLDEYDTELRGEHIVSAVRTVVERARQVDTGDMELALMQIRTPLGAHDRRGYQSIVDAVRTMTDQRNRADMVLRRLAITLDKLNRELEAYDDE